MGGEGTVGAGVEWVVGNSYLPPLIGVEGRMTNRIRVSNKQKRQQRHLLARHSLWRTMEEFCLS